MQVAIKAFRTYPAQNLKEAKEVRIQSAWEISSRTKPTDSVEAGAHVEEVVPRKYPLISRGGHDVL